MGNIFLTFNSFYLRTVKMLLLSFLSSLMPESILSTYKQSGILWYYLIDYLSCKKFSDGFVHFNKQFYCNWISVLKDCYMSLKMSRAQTHRYQIPHTIQIHQLQFLTYLAI